MVYAQYLDGPRYRILVTGSRDWTDRQAVYEALHEHAPLSRPFTVVHGGCPSGADALATDWCRANHLEPEVHRAQWRTYGKRAGFMRNTEMADLGAAVCLAFVVPCAKPEHATQEPHDSHGTAHMMGECRARGIPVVVIASGRCSCGNWFHGDNFCMLSACQWEGIAQKQERQTS